MKSLYDRFLLWLLGTAIMMLVAMDSFFSRGRMSHENGLLFRGKIKIVDDPQFPEHDFFQPGREFKCRVRHAAALHKDDAKLLARSASIKFADSDYKSPLDIEMNTGLSSVFATVWEFAQFMVPTVRGKGKFYTAYFKKHPHGWRGAQGGVRRNPGSFAKMRYYSQTAYFFKARDGRLRYVKYRLIPEDRGAESGIPTKEDAEEPWIQDPFPGETRHRNYLKQEFIERLKEKPVVYHLQLQLHEASPDDPPELFDNTTPWDDETHPWFDLATVTVEEAIAYEEGNMTIFSIGNQPPSLGIIPAKSIHDYNSINYMRVRVLPAKRARLLSYRVFGMKPAFPDEREPGHLTKQLA